MAGGKVSPRQKMINMMYLVLTALLALNISKDMLKAFAKVNNSLKSNLSNINDQSDVLYSKFSDAAEYAPLKVGPQFEIADSVKNWNVHRRLLRQDYWVLRTERHGNQISTSTLP